MIACKHGGDVSDCAYFKELFYESNRALFPCLQSHILTLGGLGEVSKVIQTREIVSGLHNCLEFSQRSSCLEKAL